MSNDTWYGVTLMFRLRYYWNNVIEVPLLFVDRQTALVCNSDTRATGSNILPVCLHLYDRLSYQYSHHKQTINAAMAPECCVPLCTNEGGHSFPFSQPGRVNQWRVAIKRDKWKPSKYSVVCHAHFVEGDYVQQTTSGMCFTYQSTI